MQSNVIHLPESNWQNPDLSILAGGARSPPALPAAMLGEFWADYSEAVAASANAPVDYVAASLLTLACALIGNARMASVAGWSEPAVCWTALIGNPSSGKSPAMDPFVALLGRLQAATGEHIQINDASAAATAEVAAATPRGLLLYSDELSGWLSRIPQLGGDAFWLTAFGARPYSVIRKDREPVDVRRLSVSVLGGVQPDVIQTFISNKSNKGFAARWLYVYPEPLRGFRIANAANHVLAEDSLLRLMRLGDGSTTEACPLTAGAQTLLGPWVGAKRDEASQSEGIWAEWLGKQGGVALRLALILEHLWWAADAPMAQSAPMEISERAYRAAIDFIDGYSAPMAERAFAIATLPQEDRLGAKLAKLIRKDGRRSFNARDVRRGALGAAGELAKAKEMALACECLELAGIIRHIGIRAGGKPGRAPTIYEVNPALWQSADTSKGGVR